MFIKLLKPCTHSIYFDLKTTQEIEPDKISKFKDRNHKKKKKVSELHPLIEEVTPSPKKRMNRKGCNKHYREHSYQYTENICEHCHKMT